MNKLDIIIGEDEIKDYLFARPDSIIDLVSSCAKALDLHWELEGFKIERKAIRDEAEEDLLCFWREVKRGIKKQAELLSLVFLKHEARKSLVSSAETFALLQTVIKFAKGEKVSASELV